MAKIDELRESFVKQSVPYIVGTDYGDGKREVAELGLGIGFDEGYHKAIDKVVEWLAREADYYIVSTDRDSHMNRCFTKNLREAMEE